MSKTKKDRFGHEAHKKDERHRRQRQGQLEVAFLLFGCHDVAFKNGQVA